MNVNLLQQEIMCIFGRHKWEKYQKPKYIKNNFAKCQDLVCGMFCIMLFLRNWSQSIITSTVSSDIFIIFLCCCCQIPDFLEHVDENWHSFLIKNYPIDYNVFKWILPCHAPLSTWANKHYQRMQFFSFAIVLKADNRADVFIICICIM